MLMYVVFNVSICVCMYVCVFMYSHLTHTEWLKEERESQGKEATPGC